MEIAPDSHGSGSASPSELGVGMRVSVHPHCDDFARVITNALSDVDDLRAAHGLVVKTDEVNTYVGASTVPAEEGLTQFANGLITATARRSGGAHVVAHILLSRGCPGETSCDLNVVGLPSAHPIRIDPSGIFAAAQWSLYPLLDSSTQSEHMTYIQAAVAAASSTNVTVTSNHYATKLAGDVADVLAVVVNSWARVGAVVPHVVSHATVSVNSPTVAGA